ncbi:MAG: tetratricopeptide repeat protein [Planctomycetales bacterium]|nr:tetratricopeptide repeat protein [Planctomycetales bacterium]
MVRTPFPECQVNCRSLGTGEERRVGPYVLEREVGRGGYGVVYRARHGESGRTVALKVLVTPEGGESVAAQRFLREIEAARVLDHPGIVRVLDTGEESGRPWFAMEYVEGRSLFEALRDEPLDWRRAAGIARDVADALAHAHARGVLHRDVKPGNILLGTRIVSGLSFGVRRAEEPSSQRQTPNDKPQATGPCVFLTDFGLARLVSTGSRLTRTGMALGTPEYMSPEQARGDVHDLTPATDVWGTGVVLYEMLAARRAFEGDSPESVVDRVVLEEPPALVRIRPDVPRGLDRVIRVCLAKSPARRYPGAGELRDDLERVLRSEPPLARPPLRPGARRALLVAILATGPATLAAAGAWLLRPGPHPGTPPGVGSPASSAPGGEAVTQAEAIATRARSLRGTDPAEGARQLAQAAALAPDHADRERWRLERGLLLWASGDATEARQEWDRIPPGRPERAASRLYRGLEAVFGGRGKDASSLLGEALASGGPESRLARGALAVLRMEWVPAREALRDLPGWEAALLRGYVEAAAPDGDPAAAVRELDAGLATGIPLPLMLVNRGCARQKIGDSAGALADLEAALRSGPPSAPAHLNRGWVRTKLGDLAGAIEDYGAALALDPTFTQAWANRADARLRLGDTASALADIEEALRGEPGSPSHLQTRAAIRSALGDPRAAAEDLTAALAARPGSTPLLNFRAVFRQQAGDLAGALADYDASLAADPRQPHSLVNRAVVRGTMGDLSGSLADLDRAIGMDPGDPKAFYNRGNVHRSLGDLRAAEADYTSALALGPDEPDALAHRGEVRRLLRDLPAAEQDLRAAVRLAPSNPYVRLRLGMVLRDRSDWAGAATALREALGGELAPSAAAQARETLAECEGHLAGARREDR